MIVWRTECILSNQPSGWEDHEVESGLSWVVGLDRHDREDRRIWVVERDRAHRVEPVQIILVGDVVTVPGNDIERTTVLCALERTSHVSIHNGPLVCRLLVGSNRRTEVSLVSQAICTDWTEIRDLEVACVTLSEPASTLALLDINGEKASAGKDDDLLGWNT